jgi:hypothetical protein
MLASLTTLAIPFERVMALSVAASKSSGVFLEHGRETGGNVYVAVQVLCRVKFGRVGHLGHADLGLGHS